ncbi:universal stress protein [Modestobacter lacusdianchii]
MTETDVQRVGGAGGGARPRVVVGVDASAGSRAALAHALLTAARTGAEVEVVAAYQVAPTWWAGPELAGVQPTDEVADATTQAIGTFVQEVRDDLAVIGAQGAADVPVQLTVDAGPAAQLLVRRAAGAAVLVVGNRGRGAVRSALLGSVALHCVTHAPCRVVVVHRTPADQGRQRTVVVGVDGSAPSRAALAVAVEEAARLGADVEAVATFTLSDQWTDGLGRSLPTVAEITADVQRRLDGAVADVFRGADHPGGTAPTVSTVVVEGAPSDVLVRRAADAELLVVGSRGRGQVRGLLLGSVGLHCAMHGPCPVMVVRPVAEVAAAG